MMDEPDFLPDDTDDSDHLGRLLDDADRILIKKLSNNDREWAVYENKHQAGVYIPAEQRDGGFFPALSTKTRPMRDDGSAPDEIRETFFTTRWPQAGGLERRTRLVHYTSKGQETHLTGVPRTMFADLLPASWLVMGRVRDRYVCLTIDSDSDEAALLRDMFVLGADFLVGEFVSADEKARQREEVLSFADRLVVAWLAGRISDFEQSDGVLPAPVELAAIARAQFLSARKLAKLDPFEMERPGDALREISREIEWRLFRERQQRLLAVKLTRLVLGDMPPRLDSSGTIRRLVDKLPEIDALMLSASQQRKSRAGYSFEHHIEAMLLGGGIPFEKQVTLRSRKRPDFVIPSLVFIDRRDPPTTTGMILSAKTTLRERWKQVEREMGGRRLFLATVDENIAASAIEDMASIGVHLVIPEGLREAKQSEYADHANVLTFREFCDSQLRPHLADWRS